MLLSVLPFVGGATTYYVKPDGNDSANGTSWNTAFRTPNKGFDKLHGATENDECLLWAGCFVSPWT